MPGREREPPTADKLCCLLMVTAAVTLLAMGYCELSKLRSRSNSTCGMRSEINVPPARSAKRTAVSQSVTSEEGHFLNLNESWPDESTSNCKHEEHKQDEASLKENFVWDATKEDNEKFERHRVDPEKVRKTANTKPLNPDAILEEPTYYRNLGMADPMHKMYHAKSQGGNAEVKFGNSCTWFGGTDAYYGARSKGKHCDCLREDCETCSR